ncbi:hypothetical protein SNEBB_005569 [Seison nebaliae]|nr:hypothetical protein SNEBB_005569 [Seison nebaliae]
MQKMSNIQNQSMSSIIPISENNILTMEGVSRYPTKFDINNTMNDENGKFFDNYNSPMNKRSLLGNDVQMNSIDNNSQTTRVTSVIYWESKCQLRFEHYVSNYDQDYLKQLIGWVYNKQKPIGVSVVMRLTDVGLLAQFMDSRNDSVTFFPMSLCHDIHYTNENGVPTLIFINRKHQKKAKYHLLVCQFNEQSENKCKKVQKIFSKLLKRYQRNPKTAKKYNELDYQQIVTIISKEKKNRRNNRILNDEGTLTKTDEKASNTMHRRTTTKRSRLKKASSNSADDLNNKKGNGKENQRLAKHNSATITSTKSNSNQKSLHGMLDLSLQDYALDDPSYTISTTTYNDINDDRTEIENVVPIQQQQQQQYNMIRDDSESSFAVDTFSSTTSVPNNFNNQLPNNNNKNNNVNLNKMHNVYQLQNDPTPFTSNRSINGDKQQQQQQHDSRHMNYMKNGNRLMASQSVDSRIPNTNLQSNKTNNNNNNNNNINLNNNNNNTFYRSNDLKTNNSQVFPSSTVNTTSHVNSGKKFFQNHSTYPNDQQQQQQQQQLQQQPPPPLPQSHSTPHGHHGHHHRRKFNNDGKLESKSKNKAKHEKRKNLNTEQFSPNYQNIEKSTGNLLIYPNETVLYNSVDGQNFLNNQSFFNTNNTSNASPKLTSTTSTILNDQQNSVDNSSFQQYENSLKIPIDFHNNQTSITSQHPQDLQQQQQQQQQQQPQQQPQQQQHVYYQTPSNSSTLSHQQSQLHMTDSNQQQQVLFRQQQQQQQQQQQTQQQQQSRIQQNNYQQMSNEFNNNRNNYSIDVSDQQQEQEQFNQQQESKQSLQSPPTTILSNPYDDANNFLVKTPYPATCNPMQELEELLLMADNEPLVVPKVKFGVNDQPASSILRSKKSEASPNFTPGIFYPHEVANTVHQNTFLNSRTHTDLISANTDWMYNQNFNGNPNNSPRKVPVKKCVSFSSNLAKVTEFPST